MIDLVALDADDTLWHNEPLYTSARERFCALLERYNPSGVADEHLYEVEMRNLRHFGYGVKGFVLSMIETAIELTDGRIASTGMWRSACGDVSRALSGMKPTVRLMRISRSMSRSE